MDLDALRRDDFVQKCIRIRERFLDQIVWNDQCIINKYAENRKLILDPRWNRQILPYSYKAAQFKQISSRENSSILHFIGSLKPWQGWCNPPVAEFWWNYANRLNIKDFAPQPITTVDQALTLAGSLDINEMYRESSTVKGNIINSLMNILNSRE
jgi:lipopolysaccharide biosynthesis glycosyltransferase